VVFQRVSVSKTVQLLFHKVCIVAAWGIQVAWAQPSTLVSPEIPTNEQRRDQERRLQEELRLQPRPDIRLQRANSPPSVQRLLGNEVPCFIVQRIDFAGEDAAQFRGLSRSLAGIDDQDAPIGRCIGATDIALLAKRAQDALITQGYVTSRVLAEPKIFPLASCSSRYLLGE
jgi:hemolysin activation/secretion protein